MLSHGNPTVLLLGRPRMVRELVVYYIRETAPDLEVMEGDRFSLEMVGAEQQSAISLIVIIDTAHNPLGLLDEVRGVREAFPGASVAIISDCLDNGIVLAALDLGIGAFISMSFSAAVLPHALRTVLNGGDFVPSAALQMPISSARHDYDDGTPTDIEAAETVLSRREREVLTLLRQGKPNKVIAAGLNMQESTVKVHMRNIMRKLQVNSRLEVILATNGGPGANHFASAGRFLSREAEATAGIAPGSEARSDARRPEGGR
jgi:two-component system, NarL family, nitrate/nitrite response regulator NarL